MQTVGELWTEQRIFGGGYPYAMVLYRFSPKSNQIVERKSARKSSLEGLG